MIDQLNSHHTPLAGAGTFAGATTEIGDSTAVSVMVDTDAAGTLFVECSGDGGTTWGISKDYEVRPNAPRRVSADLTGDRYRIRYVNGATIQTSFDLVTTQQFTVRAAEMTTDMLLEVALGTVPGYEIWNAMGERDSIGTTAGGEDMWLGNLLTPAGAAVIPTPVAAGEDMFIVSEIAADSLAGTGIQKVKLDLIAPDGTEFSQTVDMAGLTPVAVTKNRFVNDMHAVQVGTGGVAAKHIKVYKSGSATTIYNMIATGGNKSLVPHRMVPLGKRLIVKQWTPTENRAKRTAIRIRATSHHGVILPGVFIFIDSQYLTNESPGVIPLAEVIPALAIVKVTAWPTISAAGGSASWLGVMVDD